MIRPAALEAGGAAGRGPRSEPRRTPRPRVSKALLGSTTASVQQSRLFPLIDLSAGGAQIEATHGLRPGSVVIEIVGGKHNTTMLFARGPLRSCGIASAVSTAARSERPCSRRRGEADGAQATGHVPMAPPGRRFATDASWSFGRFHSGAATSRSRPFPTVRRSRASSSVRAKALFFVHEFDGLKSTRPDPQHAGARPADCGDVLRWRSDDRHDAQLLGAGPTLHVAG